MVTMPKMEAAKERGKGAGKSQGRASVYCCHAAACFGSNCRAFLEYLIAS